MTNFQKIVYDVVRQIPKGSVLTYKEVAQKIGNEKAYRAVGNALNKNNNKSVPCHRVIRNDGKTGGYNGGSKAKIQKLMEEGFLKR